MKHRIALLRLVVLFAWALLLKLWKAESKYSWNSEWITESNDSLQAGFNEHVRKGDPIDVACYCAFLWARGWDCV